MDLNNSKHFNEQIAKKIVDKIHSKGWNVYDATSWISLNDEGVIEKGSVQQIEYNKPYMIFPKIPDPKDPHMINMELILLSTDTNYKQESTAIFKNRPLIYINGFKTTLFGFMPYSKGIGIFPKPSKKDELIIEFSEFLKSLDTLVEHNYLKEDI